MTEPRDARDAAQVASEEQSATDAKRRSDAAGIAAPMDPPLMMTPDEALGLEIADEAPQSFGRQAWNRFRQHRLALVGASVLFLLIIGFFVMPLFSPYEIDEINVLDRAQGPSGSHWFGTDDLGRDLFVRAMQGGQFSIIISVLAGFLAALFGAMLGTVAGYFGGFVDSVVNFLVNILLSINLLVLLLIIATRLNLNPIQMAVVIALLSWSTGARVVRSLVLQLRDREFVLAARAAGASSVRIMTRHLLPNVASAVLVNATLLASVSIILESTLAFLGVGVEPPNTTLGTLVDEGKGSIDTNPSRVLIPGLLITLIILSINFIGDGLRDALDPTHEMDD